MAVTLAVQGQAPITLRNPLRGYSGDLVKFGPTHMALRGRRTFDEMAAKRTWNLQWKFMTEADFQAIYRLYRGDFGLGPFEYEAPDTGGLVLVNLMSLQAPVPSVGWRDVTLVLDEV